MKGGGNAYTDTLILRVENQMTQILQTFLKAPLQKLNEAICGKRITACTKKEGDCVFDINYPPRELHCKVTNYS